MKVEVSLYFVILILVYQQALMEAANCQPYKVIPVDQYDKDPKSVDDTSKHPNGFYYGFAQYPTTTTNINNKCVSISNVTDRAVGVMVQPFLTGNKICVKDNGGDVECGETISKCFDAKTYTVTYEFYCDPGKGCEGDVQFWYRLKPSEGDKDDWCTLVRSGNDFPNSLRPVPTKQTPTKENPSSGGSVPKLLIIGFINVLGTLGLLVFH